MKLKIGHLYKTKINDWFWTDGAVAGKEVSRGDILLYIGKAKKNVSKDEKVFMIYIFLDKDGQVLWLEKYECLKLERIE